MFCTVCGNQVDDKQTFCTHCGARVSSEEAPQNQAESTPAEPASPVAAAPAPASPTSASALPTPAPASTSAPSASSVPATAVMPVAAPSAAGPSQSVPASGAANSATNTTASGAAAQTPMQGAPVQNTPAPASTSTQPKQKGKLPLVAIIAVCAVVIIGVIVALFVAGPFSKKSDTVYYSSANTVKVKASTKIKPYLNDKDPLESYVLTVTPLNDASATEEMKVSGKSGFSFEEIGKTTPGNYRVEIKTSEDATMQYVAPGFAVVDSNVENSSSSGAENNDDAEIPDELIIVPDPEDDAKGLVQVTPEYSVEERSVTAHSHAIYTDMQNFEPEEYVYTYPQITCNVPSVGVEKINGILKAEAEEAVKTTEDTVDVYGTFVMRYGSSVTYLKDGYVCVYTDSHVYPLTSAHGYAERSAKIYKLETGEEVPAYEAAGMTKTIMFNAGKKALRKWHATKGSDIYTTWTDFYDDYKKQNLVENPERYYLDETYGLMIFTLDYEAGSYAYGLRNIIVEPAKGSSYRVGEEVGAPTSIIGAAESSGQ